MLFFFSAKLIRSATVRLLRYLTFLFGLHCETVQKEPAQNISSFIRDIVQTGFKGFESTMNTSPEKVLLARDLVI